VNFVTEKRYENYDYFSSGQGSECDASTCRDGDARCDYFIMTGIILCGLWGYVCGQYSYKVYKQKHWPIWKFIVLCQVTGIGGSILITLIGMSIKP